VIPHKRGGVYIYVPVEVAGDSAFPLKEKGDTLVYIQSGRLIVEKFSEKSSISEEREENYKVYLKVRDEFVEKHLGKFAVIAGGKMICMADSMKKAIEIASEKKAKVNHRIIWKIGEDEEVKTRELRGSWLRRIR
jgi:hypothetical protein